MIGIENEPINDMTIVEYVKHIQSKYYPELDIAYIDAFMKIYDDPDNNGYCINSDELSSAGILSIIDGKKNIKIK